MFLTSVESLKKDIGVRRKKKKKVAGVQRNSESELRSSLNMV